MTAYELHELTNGLFGSSYLGRYAAEKEAMMQPIYLNRLEFYRKQNLYRRWKDSCASLVSCYGEKLGEQDHVEAYTANYGSAVVVICSNYNSAPHPFLMMRQVAPLYVPFAKTYAVRFPSKEAAKAILRAFPYVLETQKQQKGAA
jgi:hypothetical protein